MSCLVCHEPLRGLMSRYHALCYWQNYTQEQALIDRRMHHMAKVPTRRTIEAGTDEDFMIHWYSAAHDINGKVASRA